MAGIIFGLSQWLAARETRRRLFLVLVSNGGAWSIGGQGRVDRARGDRELQPDSHENRTPNV
jgi:hypothetical protein